MKNLAQTYERSNIPLYLQIGTTLRRRIERGQWKTGDKISTIPELEREFGVARVTIRQAIEMLHDEGLVSRQQGRGTFVTKEVEERRWLRLGVSFSSLLESIEAQIPKFLAIEPVASPNLDEFEGEPAKDYVFMRSVQSRNREPFALVDVHLAKHVFEMAPEIFSTRAALPVLPQLDDVVIGRAHQTMVIGTAEVETAHLLKIAVNAPTAEVHCVVTDNNNTMIYVAEIIYRGDCIKFDIEFLQNLSGDPA